MREKLWFLPAWLFLCVILGWLVATLFVLATWRYRVSAGLGRVIIL